MQLLIDLALSIGFVAIAYMVIVGLVRAFYPRVPQAPEPFEDSKDWGSQ